jgi:hypothetical protein
MSAEQVPGGGARSVKEVLDLTLAQAREAGRDDLVLRLTAARRLLMRRTLQVRVNGSPRQGKSALIESLMLGPSPDVVTYEEVAPADAAGRLGSEIELAHAELYVTRASGVLTGAEVEDLRAAQDRCPNVIVVMTKIDECEGWDDVLARNRALIAEAGIGVEVRAVSAVWRMQAGWSGDEALADRSGLLALKADLVALSADAERPAVQAAVGHVLAALAELEKMLRRRRATLSAVEGPERLREQLWILERQAEALRISSARCPVVISGNCAALQGDVGLELRQRMQGVGSELDRALLGSNPVRKWPELTSWLYDLLTFEARLNREFAFDGAARVSGGTAHQLVVSEAHRVTGSQVAAPVAFPQPPDVHIALPKISPINITVVFGVLMRGWVGFAIFFTLSAAAKLHLPAVVSLVPMLLMAGLGCIEERRRWRERRRGHASAALRGYISDVTARVNKDGNDLVRGVEAELREAYGGWFERARDAVAADRVRTQRDLRAIERSPTLLGEVDDRLRDYAELKRRARGVMPARLLAR